MRQAFTAALSSTAAVAATVLAVALTSARAVAQTTASGDFTLTERSDFSRYVDGRYLGHVYRESRGVMHPAGAAGAAPAIAGARTFEGDFFVLEETIRDARDAARRVDRSAPVRLSVALGGSLEVQDDSGFPSLRGMPSMPEASVPSRGAGLQAGDSWTAEGTRSLDFEDSGSSVLIPFLAEYHFLGRTSYRGRIALSLSAKFATRWKATTGKLLGAAGTHDLDILIDAGTLSTLFIRDRFDETFSLATAAGGGTGSNERRSGFSLFFFEGSVPLDLRATGEAIVAAVDGGGTGAFEAAGLELASSPEGPVLRVKDLRFVADSDTILGTELWRLDAIAAALKALPNRSFLVAGHSAAVGKAAGELELSVKRAKRVADELATRGIEASRLLYRGFGSSQPLAPDDTEEGRAKNRRVEITVLE